jgi:hypothetical protein
MAFDPSRGLVTGHILFYLRQRRCRNSNYTASNDRMLVNIELN